MDKLLTVDEVAGILRVKTSTIYSLVHRGIIPHRKITRKMLRFTESEIMNWVDHAESSVPPSARQRKRMNPYRGGGRVKDNRLAEVVEKAISEVISN